MVKKFIMELEINDVSVYQFGSFLTGNEFNDIDLLIIYANYKDINKIIFFRKKLKEKIAEKFYLSADIILLSIDEENQLDYLKQVESMKIV